MYVLDSAVLNFCDASASIWTWTVQGLDKRWDTHLCWISDDHGDYGGGGTA